MQDIMWRDNYCHVSLQQLQALDNCISRGDHIHMEDARVADQGVAEGEVGIQVERETGGISHQRAGRGRGCR